MPDTYYPSSLTGEEIEARLLGCVRSDAAQALSNTAQETARNNISAAPDSNIQKSALSSAVQASLNKADTALQSAPVTAVDGKTGSVVILPTGGTAGQVLKKVSGTNYDVAWGDQSGGGGGGTSDYTDLTNKPQINGVTLAGNKTSYDLKVQNVNPNLLVNSYFVYGKAINNDYTANGTFPVNQRGYRTYTSPGGNVCFDRWRVYRATEVTINRYGVTLVENTSGNDMIQAFEFPQNLAGKTVTLSGLFSYMDASRSSTTSNAIGVRIQVYQGSTSTNYNGNVITSIADGTNQLSKVTVAIPSDATRVNLIVRSYNDVTYTVNALKLEVGSEQTLAHQEGSLWVLNDIPDYATELAKCQRYYVNANAGWAMAFPATIATEAKNIRITVPLPVPMATGLAVSGVTLPTTFTVCYVNTSGSSIFTTIGAGQEITFTISAVHAVNSGVRVDLLLSAALASNAFRFCIVSGNDLRFSYEPPIS